MTSASYDGEYIARIIQKLGFIAVRGSSSRNAVAAQLGMRRALASVRPENVPSRRVLDSLGFADTGLRSEDGVWCIYERSLTAAAAL